MSVIKILRGEKDSNSFYVGSNYGPLLFDTGAAASQLLQSNLTDSLVKVQTRERQGVLGSKKQDIVVVEELRVGDIRANHLQVALDDATGILGNDVLKNYAYTLNTRKDEIVLMEPFTSGIKCMVGQRGHLYVEIEIGQKTCMALIDTGASCSLIDEAFYKEMFGRISGVKTETGEDWTGATMETPMMQIDSLSIENIHFPPHEFAVLNFERIFPFMEYPIVAIIGATTLSCKKFSFNQIDGYIKIEERDLL